MQHHPTSPPAQVSHFFATLHPNGRFRAYNLCEERVYDAAHLGGVAIPDCVRHPRSIRDRSTQPFPAHPLMRTPTACATRGGMFGLPIGEALSV